MENKTRTFLTNLADELRAKGDAAAAALVDESLAEFNRRHWHEMSVALLKVVNHPIVQEQAYPLHDNVITTIRADISPVAYVKLIQAVCFSPASTMERALSIVEGAQACFVGQDATQGRYAAQCIRAMLLLQSSDSGNGNEEEKGAASKGSVRSSTGSSSAGGVWSCAQNRESAALASIPGSAPHTARKILEDVETYTQSLQMHETEPVLLAMLCRARGRDYELRGQYTLYYANAFDVVTYADKAEMVISPAEREDLAFTTAVAALLSEEIFNFGKFLNFKSFVSALEGTQEGEEAAGQQQQPAHRRWVLDWMRLCNEGDVEGCERFVKQRQGEIQSQAPVLIGAADALGKKVRLMGLLHLVFYTPFSERTFSFATIAQRCCVPEKAAEPLLLAALAQGIVKGKIDGLEGKVHISWVEPRVLSLAEVKELATHVKTWGENVVKVTGYVSEQAKQISK